MCQRAIPASRDSALAPLETLTRKPKTSTSRSIQRTVGHVGSKPANKIAGRRHCSLRYSTPQCLSTAGAETARHPLPFPVADCFRFLIYPPTPLGSKTRLGGLLGARSNSRQIICMGNFKNLLTAIQHSSGPAHFFRTWRNFVLTHILTYNCILCPPPGSIG